MARQKFSDEFKPEAVHLLTMPGVTIAQAVRDLDVHATVLRRRVQQAERRGAAAFQDNGRLAPDDPELRWLGCEVTRLKAKRFARDQT